MRKSLLETTRVVSQVPEAPVFRPSAAEFEDPLAYITSIQGQAAQFGIAKIIPPTGWANPDLELDVQSRFITKRQSVHALQEGQPFKEGGTYNQAEYHKYADMFSATFMKTHPELMAARRTMSADDYARLLEQSYWDIVERVSNEQVVVDYANDIDTEKVGSAFGKWAGRWDMTRLMSEPQSALSDLGYSVEGLTHPWLYFGALFATFCWHTEDHFLCSMNYMHTGASKTWYGVLGSGVRKFEEIMQNIFPERFSEDRDILHHLVTVAPPSLLASRGVKVVHTVQSAGEYVVTFPKAYHCGFSHGWNCSEAVNFGTLDWLPAGLDAVRRYAQGPGKRPAVFSHDKLVWELCSDALEAHRVQNGGAEQLPPPQPGFAASAAFSNKMLTTVPSGSTEEAGLQRAPVLSTHTANTPPHQLPRSVERHTVAFVPRQLRQLLKSLAPIVHSELQGYKELRFEGVGEGRMQFEDEHSSQVEADLRSCSECGALPYFSYVLCSCSPSKARCLAHAHIGCTCEWDRKCLLLRLPLTGLTQRLKLLEKIIAQDEGVKALLPRRWSGSCKAPTTAAATAAAAHHARPSVQGITADVATTTSTSLLQDTRQGRRGPPPSIKRGGGVAKQALLLQRAKQASRNASRLASRSASDSSISDPDSSASGSESSDDSDGVPADVRPSLAPKPDSAANHGPIAGAKRAAPVAAPGRLSGADKRARMRASARARLANSPTDLPVLLPPPRLHPMPQPLPATPLQQQALHVKQEAWRQGPGSGKHNVKQETHLKQDTDMKQEATWGAAAQSSPMQHPTISLGMPVHITLTPNTGIEAPLPCEVGSGDRSSSANGVDEGVNAELTLKPRPQKPAARQSPAVKSEPRPLRQLSSWPDQPDTGMTSHSRAAGTLLRPPSLPAVKSMAKSSLFEPLPMSTAEKLRRGLLSSNLR